MELGFIVMPLVAKDSVDGGSHVFLFSFLSYLINSVIESQAATNVREFFHLNARLSLL